MKYVNILDQCKKFAVSFSARDWRLQQLYYPCMFLLQFYYCPLQNVSQQLFVGNDPGKISRRVFKFKLRLDECYKPFFTCKF